MPEKIFIKRDYTETPFGFKLQGGADFSVPLSILQITANSIAEQAGLRPGDVILKLNDVDISSLEHNKAKMEIIRCGNEFTLTVERHGVDINKLAPTPLAQLKTNPPMDLTKMAPPPPQPKTDLTVDKGDSIAIGSSHNRAPMPFNREVGNTIDYKSAKPPNWKPGDYTQWTSNNQNTAGAPEEKPPTVTAVFHNQYNSPIGIYSDTNVLQEFQNQTQGLMPEPRNQSTRNTSTTSAFQNPSFDQQIKPNSSYLPRGTDSLSMHMLHENLVTAAATHSQPLSIFDLKRGYNPTGAVLPSYVQVEKPRGFRSVEAPGPLPPDQRHAPMRKEYEVKHVKQNWIEPKMN